MREFTDFEKQIIHKLVSSIEIKELSLIKLIDENTDAIALEWNLDEPNFTIVYHPSNLTEDELFNQITEIVFLLKNLEDNNFIYIHQNYKFVEDNCLYNRVKYNKERLREYSLKGSIPNSKGCMTTKAYEIKSDFGRYVQRYASSLYYVSNALRELVKNNFKTPEQFRYEVQLKKANSQIRIAWAAFITSIIAVIASLVLGIIQICSGTKIDKCQFNKLNQTIEQSNTSEIIKTEITNDTTTTRIVIKPKLNPEKRKD